MDVTLRKDQIMKTIVKSLACVATVCAITGAWAQQAGDWMIRGGYGTITPHVNSGNMNAPSFSNSQAGVGSASNLLGGVTYMYTDHFSVDLPLALPFRHKLYGAGALNGVGQLGDVEALPASVMAQYRFNQPTDSIRPYAGLGLTYAYFFNARGSSTLTSLTNPGGPATGIKVDSRWTYTGQLGVTWALDRHWFMDVFYSMTPLKTRTTFSTGQTLDITLNPTSYGLSLGYKF
jgi:outer membrane protein